ncbi:HEAT repeat domain-containing protein [Streptomyces sp. NPDC088789]|uniref:HEAT repeat domain-containing protein n=1 Tax=Streptomyces sp. NPDC088789 TaxID=3365899 RepID=UPI00380005EF
MEREHQIAFFLRELETGDTWRRAAAAKGLGRVGRAEHAPALIRSAADPSPEVRDGAATGLGRLGVRAAGHAVLPGLMADDDPWVRRRASLAAVRLGLRGPAVVAAFGRLLRDPDHPPRINALDALRSLGAVGDAPALVGLLGDPVPGVRGRAWALVHDARKDPAVPAALVRAADRADDPAREPALLALRSIYAERPWDDALLAELRAPSPAVRAVVAARLRHRADAPGTRAALRTALEAERAAEAAFWLLHALARTGEEGTIRPALRWLGDGRAGPAAARALGMAGTRAARARLRAALTDPALPSGTRGAAAEALGGSGRWDTVWLLLPLLEESGAEVRAGAVEGLAALVDAGLWPWERRAVAEALVAHLAGGRGGVRRTGQVLVGWAEALPFVREAWDRGGSSAEVRAALLALLDPDHATDAGTPGDLPRLVGALEDPDDRVVHRAATGLAHWPAAVGVPASDAVRVRARLTGLAAGAPGWVADAAGEALRALDACRTG